MGSIDSLPADQRAVLELVLRRGRSYDEIASLLSIDRAGVRQRALAALDALGPKTRVGSDRRALITDYLLHALPSEVASEVRDRLSSSASERAWARAVASELQPLSDQPLPEIPSNGRGAQAKSDPGKPARRTKARPEPAEPAAEVPVAAALSNGSPRERSRQRAGSRIGGAILLGAAAVIAIVLVLVFVVFTSNAHKHLAATAHRTTTHSTTGTSSARIISQVNLTPPAGGKSPVGLAEVISLQGRTGVAIAAQGLAANSKRPPNYYAVWLSNGATSNELVGFAAAVTKNGVLRTAGGLPTNAASYHGLLITLETSASPKTPGKVVLQGSGKL